MRGDGGNHQQHQWQHPLESIQSLHEEPPPSVEQIARHEDEPVLHAERHRPVNTEDGEKKDDELRGIEKHEPDGSAREMTWTQGEAQDPIYLGPASEGWAPRSCCGARVFNLE